MASENDYQMKDSNLYSNHIRCYYKSCTLELAQVRNCLQCGQKKLDLSYMSSLVVVKE